MIRPPEVWAPLAERVELEAGGGARRPLRQEPGGWWRGEEPHEGEYRFVVDGTALPDPRSPWQPRGVDGPSHTVDHEAFRWSNAAWTGFPLGAAVIYELHVGTFSPQGTFDGVIDRLDHLVDLGVNAIELCPVNEFPGSRGWGYDGVLLFAPHHRYGGPDGLKRLVDACHGRGLAVVLDVVYNHLGPSGNHLGRFGPYFTDRYQTPWGAAVNLDDAGSDEVRRFFCDNALQWVRDYRMDGLRLDAVHAFVDRSATHLLEQLADEVHAEAAAAGRQVWVIAESDLNDPRLVRSVEAGGFGLDAAWSDDFHHAAHAVLTGEEEGYYADYGGLAPLARALERMYVYAGEHSPHRGRRHGRGADDVHRHRFVVALQNHDQVGNRAQGDRIEHLAGTDRAAVGAALTLTGPAVPLLFQGEEWAASAPFQYFTDHPDPELGEAVRQGRRSEFASFGWRPEDVPDPQDAATFERSRLNWDEVGTEPHRSMLEWYRRLLRLRREHPALRDGRPGATTVRYDEEARWLVTERGPLAVACNLSDGELDVPVGPQRSALITANRKLDPPSGGVLRLPAWTAAIVGPRDW